MERQALIVIGGYAYEMRDATDPDRQCRDCAALGRRALCRKLPACDGVYFRRLTGYEMR